MSIPTYKSILYASDLGDNMRPVFRHAIGLARQYNAKITMLHVVRPLGATGKALMEAYLPQRENDFEHTALKKILAVMKNRLENFCREEFGEVVGVEELVSDIVVVTGNPAEEIKEQALVRDVDMIVIGAHTDFSIGSTARKLSQMTDRPLLIVPVVRK